MTTSSRRTSSNPPWKKPPSSNLIAIPGFFATIGHALTAAAPAQRVRLLLLLLLRARRQLRSLARCAGRYVLSTKLLGPLLGGEVASRDTIPVEKWQNLGAVAACRALARAIVAAATGFDTCGCAAGKGMYYDKAFEQMQKRAAGRWRGRSPPKWTVCTTCTTSVFRFAVANAPHRPSPK